MTKQKRGMSGLVWVLIILVLIGIGVGVYLLTKGNASIPSPPALPS